MSVALVASPNGSGARAPGTDPPSRAFAAITVGMSPFGCQKGSIMGELHEKAKGMANEVAGKTKQAVADATDNPKLKVEGDLQEIKGKTQRLAGDAMGALGDKI
jgi:uncharacterized protein YjbJ (UPF0337 family)